MADDSQLNIKTQPWLSDIAAEWYSPHDTLVIFTSSGTSSRNFAYAFYNTSPLKAFASNTSAKLTKFIIACFFIIVIKF